MNCAMLLDKSRPDALALMDEALDLAEHHDLQQYIGKIITIRKGYAS